MGANADTDLYLSGFRAAIMIAPLPPIEWPVIDLIVDTWKYFSTSSGSSLVMYVYMFQCLDQGAYVASQ